MHEADYNCGQTARLEAEEIEDGALRPTNMRLTSNVLPGAVNWIFRWRIETDEMSREKASDHFLDLFMSGTANQN